MPLKYTSHAEARLHERGISKLDCETVVSSDDNPWKTKLKAGDHFRCYLESLLLTVITDAKKQVVVTAFRGDPGNWGPEEENL